MFFFAEYSHDVSRKYVHVFRLKRCKSKAINYYQVMLIKKNRLQMLNRVKKSMMQSL